MLLFEIWLVCFQTWLYITLHSMLLMSLWPRVTGGSYVGNLTLEVRLLALMIKLVAVCDFYTFNCWVLSVSWSWSGQFLRVFNQLLLGTEERIFHVPRSLCHFNLLFMFWVWNISCLFLCLRVPYHLKLEKVMVVAWLEGSSGVNF